MNQFMQRILTIGFSIVLGLASYYVFTGWINVIPWSIFALLIGYLTIGRKNTIINGGFFGYFLFVTYIIIGYKGKTDETSLLKFIFFVAFFSLIGSAASIVGALLGNYFHQNLHGKKYNQPDNK